MNENFEEKDMRLQKRISALITVLLVMAVGFCLYTVIQVLSNGYVNIGGFMMFRVVTGSMEPTIPVGALLLTKEVEIETVAVNDIVCFRTQVSEIWGKIVTHRVVGITGSELGGILLETKGDANLVADGYFVDSSNLVGKVIWHTGDDSMFADVLSVFTSKIGFLGFIVMPCLILVALIMKNTVGSIRQELEMMLEIERRQQAEPAEEENPGEITEEEYTEMYERIRAELMEELKNFEGLQLEQAQCSEGTETE